MVPISATHLYEKQDEILAVVAHAFNPRAQKVEAGWVSEASLEYWVIPDQSGLHRELCLKKFEQERVREKEGGKQNEPKRLCVEELNSCFMPHLWNIWVE